MRRLEIESFFYAQTSMEIFGGELMGFLGIRTDVSHFHIKPSTQPVQTIFSTFFAGFIRIKHAHNSFVRAKKISNLLLLGNRKLAAHDGYGTGNSHLI